MQFIKVINVDVNGCLVAEISLDLGFVRKFVNFEKFNFHA
jgi:hypothetical protein